MIAIVLAAAAARRAERSRLRAHGSVNPFRGTPPITRTKWEFGTFTPSRIPANQSVTLKFSQTWKTPFFIRVGSRDPVLGDPDPGKQRQVVLPPQPPGVYPVSLTFDGIQWKELGKLTVDPPLTVEPPPTLEPPPTVEPTPIVEPPPIVDNARREFILGIVIGISIVVVSLGVAGGAWWGYRRAQRRRRQRRSDLGARFQPAAETGS
jgi:hypothetical protein